MPDVVQPGIIDMNQMAPVPNSDNTDLWLEACELARNYNNIVKLPDFPIIVSQTGVTRGIIGSPGKSKLILAPDFTKTGFANEFCILNPSFNSSYNEASADDILFKDFDIETTPNGARSILGLANVRGGKIDRVNIKANRNLDANGKPIVVNSLIDLYSAAKNVKIGNCNLQNITGGYGATKISPGGGGGIWVRNLSSNGSVDANSTEEIEIFGNIFIHRSTDEVLAVYGVRGTTRKVKIHHNYFYGLSGDVYHATFVSFFPLDDGSGPNLGNTAAVYDIDFESNYIEDRNWIYNIVRTGRSGADQSRVCRDIRTRDNEINAYYSNDSSTGPQATWVASGSPAPDPSTTMIIMRTIDGQQGVAYPFSYSGNTSTNDVVRNIGPTQIIQGFSGYSKLVNPTTEGSFFTGVSSCRKVKGGEVEVTNRGYQNCNFVSGAGARVTSSIGFQFYYDDPNPQVNHISGCLIDSAGGFISIGSTANANTEVNVSGCAGRAAAGYAITANTGTIHARGNSLSGCPSGPSTGAGTVDLVGNRWGSTSD